jgi:hypothetical protein
MIIVKLKGGLGNQMFQYAAAYSLAQKYKKTLKLDTQFFNIKKKRTFGLHNYRIFEKIISPQTINKLNPNLLIIKHKKYNLKPVDIKPNQHVYLDGFWSSEKYFKEVEKDLRIIFVPREPLNKQNTELAEHIKNSNAISIHVRRQDYLNLRNNVDICTLKYYNSSIETLISHINNPEFFIFSDDFKWTKTNIRPEFSTVYVEHNKDRRNYVDVYLMSLCKHHIIANSTFSWWGAWLNSYKQKIVIYPKRWSSDNVHNMEDRIPLDWSNRIKRLGE